ncbi:type VII toxin-antitoxin system MntA family adenylyltransferase antitoxin [Halalkalibacter alkaliphilus]|uniref:Nucleotidyltransferase domain-containing protein n=1 Tax=Halalkalibacter alkaliphilus TaxID=2917993 RepID=A0A9X2A0H6_9BACI|nr:nucleotidyltransferase domain-containing protein [Halalkalibacter alkaliphilus]MCL7745580.1 nucleotidyltransferase domain-containing protein [Halalkalibacter alkaliphilus]
MNYDKQLIVKHLIKNISPFLIILFGSTVKGTVNKSSDFDIAFLSDQKLDSYQLFMISQDLASKLNRDVDLVDLKQASTVFQAQVIHTGNVIFCSDEQKKAQFEVKVLKMYAKLNEERLPILKSIDESGAIYEK